MRKERDKKARVMDDSLSLYHLKSFRLHKNCNFQYEKPSTKKTKKQKIQFFSFQYKSRSDLIADCTEWGYNKFIWGGRMMTQTLVLFFFASLGDIVGVCVCVCVCSCNMSICVWSRLRVWQTSRERERQERVSELISERSEKGEQGKQGIHNSHFVVVVVVVLCVFRSQVNNFLIFFSEGRNTPPERK